MPYSQIKYFYMPSKLIIKLKMLHFDDRSGDHDKNTIFRLFPILIDENTLYYFSITSYTVIKIQYFKIDIFLTFLFTFLLKNVLVSSNHK